MDAVFVNTILSGIQQRNLEASTHVLPLLSKFIITCIRLYDPELPTALFFVLILCLLGCLGKAGFGPCGAYN